MRNTVAATALVLALAAAGPAKGAAVPSFYDGNLLLQLCQVSNPNLCVGYIAGIADVLSIGNAIDGFRACLPGDVTALQVAEVAAEYLSAHPETRHLTAASLAAAALQGAFPCK